MKLPIKKYVIVGSYPLNIRFAKDIDVICYEKDIEVESAGDEWSRSFMINHRKIECLLADKQESFQKILDNHRHNEAAFDWELYAIKAGHIVFPHRQWEKHIHDYHFLKRIVENTNTTTISLAASLQKLHRKCTKERLKIKTPKLKGVTKEEFFDDFVKKYYVHDNIHKAVAHKEHPMYTYMQNDVTLVECDKSLWNNFSQEEKMWTVMEEAYVIALERHIIPAEKGTLNTLRPFDAYKWALMRICTTLCSGWFREFAVENYYEILNQYDPSFISKFKNNITKYENDTEKCDSTGVM